MDTYFVIFYLVLIVANALFALALSFVAVGQSFRLGWATIGVVAAVAVFVLMAVIGPQPPINYMHVALYAPWLVWVPMSVVYGAWRRLGTGAPFLNKWLYVLAVILPCIAQGFATSAFKNLAVLIAASIGTVLLTYPLGVLALVLIALPLIYFGIATPEEGYFVASPFFALLGYLQWYIFFPHIARLRERGGSSVKAQTIADDDPLNDNSTLTATSSVPAK